MKEQNQSVELWTFNDAGKIFYVKKNKNLFRFKVCNIFSNQWHQSQDLELQRINQQTIKAAFDPKVDAVSYEMTSKTEKSINLKFKVKIEYLSTEFSQEIELKQIQMDKKQQMKLLVDELFTQTNKLEAQAEQQIKNMNFNIAIEKSSFRTSSNQMFVVDLKQGKYIFSVTGFYISETMYNGEYVDYGDVYGNISRYNIALHLKVKIGKNSQLQFVSTTPQFTESYEYPYTLTGILDVEKEENVRFVFEGYKSHEVLMMNNNLLSIYRLS